MLLRSSVVVIGFLCAEALPEYCSKVDTPENQKLFEQARTIPELSAEAVERNLRLLQVTTLIRHGARAPAEKYSCWTGYDQQWDCEVEESIRPIQMENQGANAENRTPRLVAFRKAYDVLPNANELKGNCGVGHLLSEGYQQHQIMGRLFAEYYQSLKEPLFPHNFSRADILSSIWFRSSDIQRTLLSGSTFMNSFLNTAKFDVPDDAITIHTMDESVDSIFPNFKACPKLQSLKEELFASGTFTEIEAKFASTRSAVGKITEVTSWPGEFFDCLLTMICTHGIETMEQSFPELDRETLLNDTIKAVDDYTMFQFTTRDQLYAKTASFKFMLEVKTELVRLLVADITQKLGATEPAMAAQMLAKVIPKDDLHEFYTLLLKGSTLDFPFQIRRFVLYSGHDTSILQFLGALGEATFLYKWPPYASQVVMEIYQDEHDYYFRLIFNGVVITDRIPECRDKSLPRDICSLTSFFEATKWATPSKIEEFCGLSVN